MADDSYDFPETEVQSIRSEMKDWLTRNLLTTAAVAPIGTVAVATVEKLGDHKDDAVGVAAAALLCLLAIANLSGYCAFARAKAVAYLQRYHPHFLTRSPKERSDAKAEQKWGNKKCGDISSNEAEVVLSIFHCVFAPFLALTITDGVPGSQKYLLLLSWPLFIGLTNYWRCRSTKITWNLDLPTCALHVDEGNHRSVYKDAEIKVLREDIRDWQTRRFTLLTAAFAVVGFAFASCEKLPRSNTANLCNLALLTLVTLCALTLIGGSANGAASFYLRTRYPAFQWELRIDAWNREPGNGKGRLKQSLPLVYLLLALLVLRYALEYSPNICILLVPGVLGIVLVGAALAGRLDGSGGSNKQ